MVLATLTSEPVRSLSSGSHVPESCHSLRLPAMPRMSFSGMLLLSAGFRSVSLRSSLLLIPTWAVRALCSGRSDRTQIPVFVIQGRSLPSFGMLELFATTTPKFGRGSLGCSGNSWEILQWHFCKSNMSMRLKCGTCFSMRLLPSRSSPRPVQTGLLVES